LLPIEFLFKDITEKEKSSSSQKQEFTHTFFLLIHSFAPSRSGCLNLKKTFL
jgi:hypothetical protein